MLLFIIHKHDSFKTKPKKNSYFENSGLLFVRKLMIGSFPPAPDFCRFFWLWLTLPHFVWLCLILSDFASFCLTFADFDWLLLTFADFVWLWKVGFKSAKKHYIWVLNHILDSSRAGAPNGFWRAFIFRWSRNLESKGSESVTMPQPPAKSVTKKLV
jgi:hypothetical protein